MPVVIDDENYETVSSFYSKMGISKTNVTPLKANMDGVDYYLSSTSKVDNSSLKYIDRASNGINDDAVSNLKNIYNKKGLISPIWNPNGQCIPGIQRVFVDCNGNIYPCEKILENEALIIGNIRDGFNISKIYEMLSIGKLSDDKCKNCWAMRFCEICVSLCLDIDSNRISPYVKEKACKAQEEKALWLFKKIIKGD